MRLTSLSLCLMALGATAAQASPQGYLHGKLGYFYSVSEADGGARAEDATVLGSVGGSTHLWQPWFARVDGGATISSTTAANDNVSSTAEVVSGHANLGLFPVSRFPFSLRYTQADRDYDWENKRTNEDRFFRFTRTRSLTARQSLIGKSGMRLDGWFNQRMRDHDNHDNNEYDTEDRTLGLKFKSRGRNQNFYASAIQQEQQASDVNEFATNTKLSATHNFFPSSEFYIKTLGSEVKYSIDDTSQYSNHAFKSQSESTIDQLTSFFYWRPEHKPYTMTGGARFHRRDADFGVAATQQNSVNLNLAMNYQINRKARLTATANASSLDIQSSPDNGQPPQDSNDNNSLGAKAAVSALYQSDRTLLNEFVYYWFADGGLNEEVVAQYEATEDTQGATANLGHAVSRQWPTGNRSSLRVSLQQSARESVQRGLREDEVLAALHSASVSWSEHLREGSSYAQLTVIDSRELTDDVDTQMASFQFSRNVNISRLSSWGGNLTVQSNRQNAGDGSNVVLTTTSTAQLNYQHSRLFGIYRLKFKTKLEGTSISSKDGADRKQADWEGRIAYNIGKLNTALFLRAMESDSGIGNRMGVFQINRSF